MELDNLVQLIKNKKYKITFAESLTGGLLASSIVNISGASSIFDAGFVTYSNFMKEKILKVKKKTIEKYGVVSENVAIEMAKGAKKITNANIVISTSGNAGPDVLENKPVGMVCFCIILNDKIFSFTEEFGDVGRNNVRNKCVSFAFNKLFSILSDDNDKDNL